MGIRKELVGCLAALLVALFVGNVKAAEGEGAASESGSPPPKASRSYTGRVEWHAAPVELETPQRVEEPMHTPSEILPMEKPSRLDTGVRDAIAPLYLYQQPPPRLHDRDEKRKQRNWLVLNVEQQKAAGASREKKSSLPSTETEEEDTGWGWLATAVLRQQEKIQAEKEEAEEAEEETDAYTPLLPTEAIKQMAIDSRTQSGLIVSPAADASTYANPVVKPMLDAQEQRNLQRVAIDEGVVSSARNDAPDRARTASSRPDTGIAQPLAELADAPVFNNDALRKDAIATPASVLPQTAALLSRREAAETTPPASAQIRPTPLFQAEKPVSAFDLSMPSPRVSDSGIFRATASQPLSSGGGGFFSAPRQSEFSIQPTRPSGSGLLMPSPSPAMSPSPTPSSWSAGASGMESPTFPTAPSWRR